MNLTWSSTYMIRQKLLDTGFIESNESFEKYIAIVSNPDKEGYVERHHILPASYFRIKGIPIDNTKENFVTLSAYNHILAHYYLYRCVTNPEWKNRLALTFMFMKKGQQGHLLTLPEEEFLKLLPEYAELSKYDYWKGRKRSRDSVQRSIATRMQNKDEIYEKISMANRGKKRTEEMKQRMRESQKKRDLSTFRGPEMTPERKQHLRELNLGKKQSEETKQKRRESLHKLQWFTNGQEDVRSEFCPDGFYKGRTYKMNSETKSKCSQSGKKWFNNGVKNTMAVECPEGFVPGRMK